MSQQVIWTAALLGVTAGCATPPPREAPAPLFYPPPPETARLQFLTSYSGAEDLGRSYSPFLTFLVGPPPPAEPLVKPYGVSLSRGKIYACDTVSRSVAVFDLDARRFRHWTPRGEGRLQTPINLSVAADGTIYVADARRGQVLIFDAAGAYRGAVGHPADMKPTDVAVTDDRLYVADLLHHRVAVHDRDTLALRFTIPRDSADETARLFSPTNLSLDAGNRLYVTDSGAFRVQQYDADGQYLRTIGAHGDGPGQFARPKGLAVDRNGLLYVVDAAMQAVQVFDPAGRLLMHFGRPGASAAPLSLPADVYIDYDHVDRFAAYTAPGFEVEYLVLVSSQYGERKISVYGFGRPI